MSLDKDSLQEFTMPFLGHALRVKTSRNGVAEILWMDKISQQKSPLSSSQQKIKKSIEQFTNGKRPLDLPIDWNAVSGTEFQKKVWKKMAQIPYGKTKSYGEIAKSLKKPGAARAVGTACGKNPVLLAIPCHRVVGGSGLGGFSGGGLSVKKKLLSIEGSL
jgi:methylated-DNA-[protein]-cysteine S-methyltransferase